MAFKVMTDAELNTKLADLKSSLVSSTVLKLQPNQSALGYFTGFSPALVNNPTSGEANMMDHVVLENDDGDRALILATASILSQVMRYDPAKRPPLAITNTGEIQKLPGNKSVHIYLVRGPRESLIPASVVPYSEKAMALLPASTARLLENGHYKRVVEVEDAIVEESDNNAASDSKGSASVQTAQPVTSPDPAPTGKGRPNKR